MAGELYPSNQWVAPMPPPSQSANLPVPTGWGSRNFSSDPRNGGVSWRRYAAAIRRYKWMIAGITAAGAIAGLALTRLVQPNYEVRSRIWIASENSQYRPGEDRVTPLGERQLLDASAWAELLTSNTVLDSVVQELSLFVAPTRREDAHHFPGKPPSRARGTLQPGSYTLKLDGNGRYTLSGRPRHARSEQTLETGTLGSPVGTRLGFDWTPPRLTGAREIDFNVTSLRQAAIDLAERLKVQLTERSFLVLPREPEAHQQLAGLVLRGDEQRGGEHLHLGDDEAAGQ